MNDNFLKQWNENKLVNPITKRKIKLNGPTYNKFKKLYESKFSIICNYINHRRNKIDPLTLENVDENAFKYKYKWNPYNGIVKGVDKNGPLYFEPESLIHFFYINRLKHLWYKESNVNGVYTQGYYGDGVGNGPLFKVNSRGEHPDWFLFRLPIYDEYLNKDHCYQSVTMGPKLKLVDIKKIKKLSNRKKFKEKFNYKMPNIVKLYELYMKSIICNFYKIDITKIGLPDNEIKQLLYQENINAVNRLRLFK